MIATLTSLILVSGFAMIVYSSTITDLSVIKRLADLHHAEMDRRSVRNLLRPKLGEAMLRFEAVEPLLLNGTQFDVEYKGRTIHVSAQDLAGLINPHKTDVDLKRRALPSDWAALSSRLRQAGLQNLPLPMRLAQEGGSLDMVRVSASWLSLNPDAGTMDTPAISARYSTKVSGWDDPEFKRVQSSNIMVTVK